jgi:Glycosyltransferase family 87
MGPRWAALIWHFLSLVLIAGTLWLGQGLARNVLGRESPVWLPFVGFFLLIPFLHLAARYNQTVFLMVFLTMLALRLIERRPLLAGVLLALPGAIKLLPLVLGPWLLWKRQGRVFAGWVIGLVLSMLPFFVILGPELATHQLQAYVHMIGEDSSFASYHERFKGMPSLVHGTVVEDYTPEMSSDPHVARWKGVRNFLGFEPFTSWAQGIVILLSLVLVLGCAAVCRWKKPETLRRWLGEIGLVLLAMLLLSPHTWGHYLWWLYPITLFASIEWVEPRRRGWAKTFLLVLLVMLTIPHRGLLGFAPILWQAWAVFHGVTIGMILLYVLQARRLWRGRSLPEG